MSRTASRKGDLTRRRLLGLMAAGLVDSFCLSLAWTVVVLELTSRYGLVAAGVCSTAMLVGVALSAPIASSMAQRLDGRRLLRTAGGIEAVLRVAVFALLMGGAPVWLLGVCVAAMNVVAWTGYAGMRAEVAAVSDGAAGITWYGTIVAAVEAVGVAAGALLPLGSGGAPSTAVLTAVTLLYVLALVPTFVVAGGSQVPQALRSPGRTLLGRRPSKATLQGALVMTVASAPTLLAVALAAELHGRAAVGLSAGAFTVGSLLAPAMAGFVERMQRNNLTWWLVLGAGMVLGWTMAAQAVVWLCVAQLVSGCCMTTLEGLLDTRAAQERPHAVTAALARATAARALGSAVGTAVLPVVIASAGLPATAVALTAGLAVIAVTTKIVGAVGRPGLSTEGEASSSGNWSEPTRPVAASASAA